MSPSKEEIFCLILPNASESTAKFNRDNQSFFNFISGMAFPFIYSPFTNPPFKMS